MLKHRVIPLLQMLDSSIVKTVGFSSPRIVGDAMSTVKVFTLRVADELILIDILATQKGERPQIEFIAEIAKHCFMPLTIGGGIKSLDEASQIFDSGSDKVAFGSLFHENPIRIEKIANRYGQQAIVATIDCIMHEGSYRTFHCSGSIPSLSLTAAIERANNIGVGEIVLTSIDRDGKMVGYELDLIQEASSLSQMPIVCNGGAGTSAHILEALSCGASAVAASSIFLWEGSTIHEIKRDLDSAGIPVRL